jgi:hypothetical protein
MSAGPGPVHGLLDDLPALGTLDLNVAVIDHRDPTIFAHAPMQDGLASVNETRHLGLILGTEAIRLMPRHVHLAVNRRDDAEPGWRRCGRTWNV